MARFKVLLLSTLLLAAIELATSGRGTGSPRLRQSISVTPASAEAHTFPSGQVQFTAMGAYNKPPSPSQPSQDGRYQIPLLQRLAPRVGAMQSRRIESGHRKGQRVATVQWHELYTSPDFGRRTTQLSLT